MWKIWNCHSKYKVSEVAVYILFSVTLQRLGLIFVTAACWPFLFMGCKIVTFFQSHWCVTVTHSVYSGTGGPLGLPIVKCECHSKHLICHAGEMYFNQSIKMICRCWLFPFLFFLHFHGDTQTQSLRLCRIMLKGFVCTVINTGQC